MMIMTVTLILKFNLKILWFYVTPDYSATVWTEMHSNLPTFFIQLKFKKVEFMWCKKIFQALIIVVNKKKKRKKKKHFCGQKDNIL
jgi:hypothetical protein